MAKSGKTSPIVSAIRELRATDLEVDKEFDRINAQYDPQIAAARENAGERMSREIRARKKEEWDRAWSRREAKYLAIKEAAMAALGLDEEGFEVFLGIFAPEQFDFGTDIKGI